MTRGVRRMPWISPSRTGPVREREALAAAWVDADVQRFGVPSGVSEAAKVRQVSQRGHCASAAREVRPAVRGVGVGYSEAALDAPGGGRPLVPAPAREPLGPRLRAG